MIKDLYSQPFEKQCICPASQTAYLLCICMKIAICSSYLPFVKGGAINIVEWLAAMLREAGHQVECIYLPHVDDSEKIFSQMTGFRWLRLQDTADRIICLRPPAHIIPHPHKLLWFIHHFRIFFDLWDRPEYCGLPKNAAYRGLREAIRAVDTASLLEARHIFTNSQVISKRLQEFNQINSEVLYPPLYRPERFHCESYNSEVVYICRVEPGKRQHLLVEAMAYAKSPVTLRLCGASLGESYPEQLRALIKEHNLEGKVFFEYGWISEARKAELLANCLAAAYLPFDEDSYGYPSLEASHASKAILSTSDAGGVMELLNHRENGLICEPNPLALAEALDELYYNKKATQVMGRAANARLQTLNINWPHVLDRMLSV